MECMYCSKKMATTNSRAQKKTNSVWRRKYCPHCHATFTSIESLDLTKSIRVASGKRLEPFSRDKLFISLYEACKHRKDATEAATGLTDTVISRLLPSITNATVNRADIITTAQKALAHFDKAAASSYLAFHPIK